MSQPFIISNAITALKPYIFSCHAKRPMRLILLLETRFSTRLVNKAVHDALEHRFCAALTGLHRRWALRLRDDHINISSLTSKSFPSHCASASSWEQLTRCRSGRLRPGIKIEPRKQRGRSPSETKLSLPTESIT
jgi:hypothetical protein